MICDRSCLKTVLGVALILGTVAPAAAQTVPPPAEHEHPAPAGAPAARLYDDLGSYHRAITASSPEAQRWFDQGFRLLFAFNLEEAQRSFEEAARIDPGCAMCWWGVGMSLGPHINLPGQPDRTKPANQAAQRAAAAARDSEITPAERALIEALTRRYSDPPPYTPEAQRALDTAYADAMREVARRFPEDMDVQALYAEAMMNLRPWGLWTIDGKPKPGTEEIVTTLEKVLAKNPDHPGANHYYIHAVEASPNPGKALAAADRIAILNPGAAHMVHMPSHIYARTGRWEQASEANRRAIGIDKRYLESAGPLSFYVMYAAHNYQFLWFTALMQGRSAEALDNARAVVAQAPAEMLEHMPSLNFLHGYPIWSLVRLGRWQDVLAEPAPPLGFPYVRAVWHAARGVALVQLGKLDEAAAERDLMKSVAASVPADAVQGLNSAKTLLDVASGILDGRLATARGQRDEAVQRLQAAVQAEDTLLYNEPPDWYYPARQELGAVLHAAGRPAEAQKVWEEDLRRNPENGWSLAGLAASLRAQKKEKEAAAVQERFAKAWAKADVRNAVEP